MTRHPFQRPPYYDWSLDRWKVGVALLLFFWVLALLILTPPPSLPPPAPAFVLTQPQPGTVAAGTGQIFQGSAPANSLVLVLDTDLGELGRVQAQADGTWRLETGSAWLPGAYRLQAAILDPLTLQTKERSTVIPVVAVASPPPPTTLQTVDFAPDGESLSLAGQAPPGLTVSLIQLADDRRTPLGQAQADLGGRWQVDNLPSPAMSMQVLLIAQDPTGAVQDEAGPFPIARPGSEPVAGIATPPLPAEPTPTVPPLPTALPTALAPEMPSMPDLGPGTPVILLPDPGQTVAPGNLRLAGTGLPGSRLRLEFSRLGPEPAQGDASALPSALAWVANDGKWAVDLGTGWAAGRYRVEAVALDPAGMASSRSQSVDFVVTAEDAYPPPAPSTTPFAPAAPSPSTTVNTRFPRFSGQAEAGRLLWVQILDGDGHAQQGFVRADGAGRWQFVPALPLAPGITTATVQAGEGEDSVGSQLAILILDQASMSGSLAGTLQVMAPGPGMLTNRLPPIWGLAAPGSQVTIRLNDQVAATAQADALGNWYALPPAPLGVGDHRLLVSDDRGGEIGPLILTVEAQTPTMPAPALDSVSMPGDGSRFTVSGVAQPGQRVEILVNGRLAAAVMADGLGSWRWQPAQDQPAGPVYVQARLAGSAGELISVSEIQVVIPRISVP